MPVTDAEKTSKNRGARSQGRPRSEASRASILATVLDLLSRKSLREISIEEVAKESGVAKTTVYRWWDTKAQLAIDAFLNDISLKAPFTEKETVIETIRSQVRSLAFQYKGRDGEIIRQIIAECQGNAKDLAMFRERFLTIRRGAAIETLQRARDEGLLKTDITDDTLIDLIYGPIYYRLMLQHATIDDEFVDSILGFFFDGTAFALEGNTDEPA
ncbi:TetR/AcrR family transcriptional regulator [Octadecabacter sp.]|nr:TetR/AcrR family transcriptional regulator [Octadecabacter sp.]